MLKIKCRLTFITHNKIAAIKVLREATDLGLKEAKDFCDAAFDYHHLGNGRLHPLPIILTAQQFGILEVHSRIHPEGPILSISNLEIVKDASPVCDLSDNVRVD